MSSNLKVLQVIPKLGYGGAETGCYDLAHYLPEKKCSSFIVTSGGELIIAISPEKTSNDNWDKHADEFFEKMKSMGNVRLPGERRHKNRLDKGPRNINEELINKIKSLS